MIASRAGRAGLVLLALALTPRTAPASQDTPPSAPHTLASALALRIPDADAAVFLPPAGGEIGDAWGATDGEQAQGPAAFLFHSRRTPRAASPAKPRPPITLSAERAKLLLRSLTVPGWGQLTTGHRTAAAVFGLAEAGVWTTYTAFRVQNQLRRDAFVRTARVLGGIDLHGRDEEFMRIVGSYASSDEYNQLVVARDAANLYYNDPAAFQAYFDAHALKGADTWVWPDDEALLRYRGQRKDAQRAALRANASLAMAIVNRLLSAIHAARLSSPATQHSLQLEALPSADDPTAFRVGVLHRF